MIADHAPLAITLITTAFGQPHHAIRVSLVRFTTEALADLAGRLAHTSANAEPVPLHICIATKSVWRSVVHDVPMSHNEDTITVVQGNGQALLDQEYRYAALTDLKNRFDEALYDLGSQTLRWFIEQEYFGRPSRERHMVNICCSPPNSLSALVSFLS